MTERRRCFDTFSGERCEKPLLHEGHHGTSVLVWARQLDRKPAWLSRLTAKELTTRGVA